MAFQHMHKHGILSSYVRRMVHNPYVVELEIPVHIPNG